NETFPYMTAKRLRINECEILAQRVTYVGELGWEIYMRSDDAPKVFDALMRAGKEFGITPCGYKALESLRLEKSYRYWTTDITPADNPYEAGLGFCVHLNKDNFIGRDALMKIKTEGAQRKLTTLTMDGSASIYGGEAISMNGTVVGRLRSGGYGYTVGKNIGLAYLPMELTKEGTELSVEVFGEKISARVDADVLYDAEGKRIKA
ncbi:MAG: aminomethyl transferase family protein, partial [Chloroflexi bacterium]|nr:aminomethyl transferase family protein [Chloroflexota bacterium]